MKSSEEEFETSPKIKFKPELEKRIKQAPLASNESKPGARGEGLIFLDRIQGLP